MPKKSHKLKRKFIKRKFKFSRIHILIFALLFAVIGVYFFVSSRAATEGQGQRADFNGDGIADLLFYSPGPSADYVWYGTSTQGKFDSQQVSINGTYETYTGDFDGDGKGDIFFYAPGTAGDYIWYGTATKGTFDSKQKNANGTYAVSVGDFDGDKRGDILFYAPGAGGDYIWYGTATKGSFTDTSVAINGTFAVLPADYNGDSRDDILFYAAGTAADYVWYGTATKGVFNSIATPANGTYQIFSGDYNGDNIKDIFYYAPGTAGDYIWYGTATKGQFTSVAVSANGIYQPQIGDFNADNRDDILFYAIGATPDYIWYGNANNSFTSNGISIVGDFVTSVGNYDGIAGDDILLYAAGAASDYVRYGQTNNTFKSVGVSIIGNYQVVGSDQSSTTSSSQDTTSTTENTTGVKVGTVAPVANSSGYSSALGDLSGCPALRPKLEVAKAGNNQACYNLYRVWMKLKGYGNGYTLTADGKFTDNAKSQLLVLQYEYALAFDGVVGAEEWKALEDSTVKKVNNFGAVVAYVQVVENSKAQQSVPVSIPPAGTDCRNTILNQGSSNSACVKVAQTKLNTLGFNAGAIDGKYGPATAAAVVRLRIANTIRTCTDGSINRYVWNVLYGQPSGEANNTCDQNQETQSGDTSLYPWPSENHTRNFASEIVNNNFYQPIVFCVSVAKDAASDASLFNKTVPLGVYKIDLQGTRVPEVTQYVKFVEQRSSIFWSGCTTVYFRASGTSTYKITASVPGYWVNIYRK